MVYQRQILFVSYNNTVFKPYLCTILYSVVHRPRFSVKTSVVSGVNQSIGPCLDKEHTIFQFEYSTLCTFKYKNKILIVFLKFHIWKNSKEQYIYRAS